MIKQMKQSACALAVLAATTLPAMAESVDVRVIGTITPTACTPTLSGGGTIDYGAINPATLSETNYTLLSERQIDFAITCTAPAKVALKATNMRPGTVAGATEFASVNTAFHPDGFFMFGLASKLAVVGLGLDGTAKIGGYAVRLVPKTVNADGVEVDLIHQTPGTGAWGVATGILYTNGPREASWATKGTTVPVAFTTLAGKLGVQAYLNKASELDLSKPVALDGLTTIELVYL